jgi:hypothetical protein
MMKTKRPWPEVRTEPGVNSDSLASDFQLQIYEIIWNDLKTCTSILGFHCY